ncbi:glycoside hydrolase family 95-like protein [Micromonospora sp. NPDC047738]|uniref:glycoside hydrolase family 95-like protein n=1 Tax=Micromonospora sp. NPDC047738 TaxID=3155741 RepID=UPI0033FEDE7A
MLVQSSGGVVKVFPAVSGRWPDASIAGLRTQGAFLLDASRSDGRTDWVRIHSEAGQPLLLQHGIDGDIDVRDERDRPVPWRAQGRATISLQLPVGASAVITRRGSSPDLAPRDVAPLGDAPVFGLPQPPVSR